MDNKCKSAAVALFISAERRDTLRGLAKSYCAALSDLSQGKNALCGDEVKSLNKVFLESGLDPYLKQNLGKAGILKIPPVASIYDQREAAKKAAQREAMRLKVLAAHEAQLGAVDDKETASREGASLARATLAHAHLYTHYTFFIQ